MNGPFQRFIGTLKRMFGFFGGRRPGKSRRRRVRLEVRPLEDRTMPSTVYYTGLGADPTLWSDGENYSGHAVPNSQDDLIIDSNAQTQVINVDTTASVHSLTIDNANLELDVNNPLTVQNLELDAGTIAGTDTLAIDAAFTWNEGAVAGSGALVLGADSQNVIQGNGDKTCYRSIDNYGSLVLSGPLVAGGTTLNNHADAVFDVASGGGWTGTAPDIVNAGLVQKTGGGDTDFGNCDNTGTLDVEAGAAYFGYLTTSGTLTGPGDINVIAAMTWSGGTVSGDGPLNFGIQTSLTIDSESALTLSRTINVPDTSVAITWVAGDIEAVDAVFNNGGWFIAQGDKSWLESGDGAFNNFGGLENSEDGTVTFLTPVNNTGSVDVQSGTWVFAAGGSSTADIDVAEDAVVEFADGDFTLMGAITGDGTAVVSAGTVFAPDCTVDNLSLTGGELDSLIITINVTMTWTDGTLGGAGVTIIATGAQLNLSGAGAHYLEDDQIIEVEGALVWTDGGSLDTESTGIVQNNGSVDAQGDGTWAADITLNNAGSLTKSGTNSGTTTINGPVVNTGTVTVAAGTLELGDGANSGEVILEPDTTLVYNGETYTLSSSATANFTAQGGYVYQGTEDESSDSQTLATFTDPDGEDALESYSATIDWGDGSSPEAGTIGYAGGVFSVTASHTYQDPGEFSLTVVISRDNVGDVLVNAEAEVEAAAAANFTYWTDANNTGLWSDAENWDGGLPDATKVVVFGRGLDDPRNIISCTFDGAVQESNRVVAGLQTTDAYAGTLILNSGMSLTVAPDSDDERTGFKWTSQDANIYQDTIDDILIISGGTKFHNYWSGGTINTNTTASNIYINGGTLNITEWATALGSNIIIGADSDGNAELQLGGQQRSLIVNNNAYIQLADNTSDVTPPNQLLFNANVARGAVFKGLELGANSGDSYIDNYGIITRNNRGWYQIDLPVKNESGQYYSGVLDLKDLLWISGRSQNQTANYSVDQEGGQIIFENTALKCQGVLVNGGEILTYGGEISGVIVKDDGFQGTLLVFNAGTIRISADNPGSYGQFRVLGDMNWNGGTYEAYVNSNLNNEQTRLLVTGTLNCNQGSHLHVNLVGQGNETTWRPIGGGGNPIGGGIILDNANPFQIFLNIPGAGAVTVSR